MKHYKLSILAASFIAVIYPHVLMADTVRTYAGEPCPEGYSEVFSGQTSSTSPSDFRCVPSDTSPPRDVIDLSCKVCKRD